MGTQHGLFPLRIEQIEIIEHFPCFKHNFLNIAQKIEHIEHFPCFKHFLNFTLYLKGFRHLCQSHSISPPHPPPTSSSPTSFPQFSHKKKTKRGPASLCKREEVGEGGARGVVWGCGLGGGGVRGVNLRVTHASTDAAIRKRRKRKRERERTRERERERGTARNKGTGRKKKKKTKGKKQL